MASNQGDRQAAVRAITGTALSYEGDWHALFDLASIPVGDFDGRLLAWINQGLGTSYTEINGAKAALATAGGSQNWDSFTLFGEPAAPFQFVTERALVVPEDGLLVFERA